MRVDADRLQWLLSQWTRESKTSATVYQAETSEDLIHSIAASGVDGIVVTPGTAPEDIVAGAIDTKGVPAVAVDLYRSHQLAEGRLSRACEAVIYGRGINGYYWGLRHLAARTSWGLETLAYGDEPEQLADLRLPRGAPPFPVAVLIHGGGWAERWTRDLMDGLAVDLARRGYASWNVEYRRVGSTGGWPQTFDDVASAIGALAHIPQSDMLDLSRVAFVGHSAGAQLALWAAARTRPSSSPAPQAIRPSLVISLAGVTHMAEAAHRGLGGEDVVTPLLGGAPDKFPERYEATSPDLLLPLGVPQLLVQGREDSLTDLIDLNALYFAKARSAGDQVELLELSDADHFTIIDPSSKNWYAVAERLQELIPA